ncbi:hypothetical protein [Clostridium uliginosum]|uniref:Lipoprotein n=1 Tax=Clostridium uliginosum TaxID=119641 RepID=A0A1I1H0F3_9CLOT|nr:hypothetical protein [Clostridium uliginosum]SFC17261.1 hypothetical protein SAMN05421842_101125 [Clostridium uliginosum]
MKRKSILTLTLVSMLSTVVLIGGCNSAKTTDKNAKTNIEQSAEKVKDDVANVGNNIKYTAIDLKNDIVNAGYKLKDSAEGKKEYFKGTETDYMLGNDRVRIYEYDSADKLQADINTISANGMSINGADVGYTNKPYYYRKGNSLIVYEGKDKKYIDQFNTTLGNTIIP